MTVVIFHNANCSKSRAVLDIVREAGETPVVVHYMKTSWTKPQLQALFAVADISAADALRTARGKAADLGLVSDRVTDDQILDAMVEHPDLVERPLVCSPKGVAICRPPEKVRDLI